MCAALVGAATVALFPRRVVKLLLNALITGREVLLYFERDSVDDPWYMKLEDSLRELSPDTAKQN